MRLGVETALVDGALVPGDVEIADGKVTATGLSSPGGRGIAAPGFVDLQVNGFGDVDFFDADADGYRRAGDALLATGVTAYLPTFLTAPEERFVAALRAIPIRTDGARILGAHLEGPFISPTRLGVHPVDARLDPDPDLLEQFLAAGPVRLVTLAPELPGSPALIHTLVRRGISVSLGHSDATAEEANTAFDAGARSVTHVFNAMRPFHHRDPGIATAALIRDDVIVQMIVDGVHLAPETARLVWQVARGRVALVTDHTTVPGGRTAEGVLAGSTVTMIDAVRNLCALGASLEDALLAATAVPARVIGETTAGQLVPGSTADIVVVTDDLEIGRVLVDGVDRLSR